MDETCVTCQHPLDSHGTRYGTACRECLALARGVSVFIQVFPVCEAFERRRCTLRFSDLDRCGEAPVVAVSLVEPDEARCDVHVSRAPRALPIRSGAWVDEFGYAYGF